MSGFEIAGVVLGALPLLISAMEHYESSLDRVLAFFKWKDELHKAMRELWIQHSYYEMTLRNLLVGMVDEAELVEMMSQPQSPLWKSPGLDEKLRQKLGAAHGIYGYTIQNMGRHMETLASHLDIDRKRVCSLYCILEARSKPLTGNSLRRTSLLATSRPYYRPIPRCRAHNNRASPSSSSGVA